MRARHRSGLIRLDERGVDRIGLTRGEDTRRVGDDQVVADDVPAACESIAEASKAFEIRLRGGILDQHDRKTPRPSEQPIDQLRTGERDAVCA